jgi:hypothetical protein
MNIGVVVEGQSDSKVYPILIKRLRRDIGTLQVRECGGKSKLRSGFVGFLREFDRNPAWRINAAFVIRDSDCHPPGPIEEQLHDAQNASGYIPQFVVEFFATQCVLESWLLGDLGAIQTVSQNRGKPAAPLPPSIQIPNANSAGDKDIFASVLSHFGLRTTPEVYGEIAARADLTRIRNRCVYFGEFEARVVRI